MIRCIRIIFDWLKRYYSFRLSWISLTLNLRRLVSDFWWPLSATLGFDKTSSVEFNYWCPVLFINIFVFGLPFKILCCIFIRLSWHILRVMNTLYFFLWHIWCNIREHANKLKLRQILQHLKINSTIFHLVSSQSKSFQYLVNSYHVFAFILA